MTRLRGARRASEEELVWMDISLTIGPVPVEFSRDELEARWRMIGDEIMASWQTKSSRPWGWWAFEQGEEPPPQEPGAETARLAELGELRPEEVSGCE